MFPELSFYCKIEDFQTVCALGRNLPRTTIFRFSEAFDSCLQKLQSTGFIPAKLNFSDFFLNIVTFFKNPCNPMQLRSSSKLEMWKNLRQKFTLYIKLLNNNGTELLQWIISKWALMRITAYFTIEIHDFRANALGEDIVQDQ